MPVCSLVSEHGEVGIAYHVDDLIGRRHVETVAEPVQRHLSGCHGVKHEHVEFFETVGLDCHGAGIVEFHAPIISMGFGGSLVLVCHLANWSEAADQFLTLMVQWES